MTVFGVTLGKSKNNSLPSIDVDDKVSGLIILNEQRPEEISGLAWRFHILPPSLMRVSMAPLFLMLSERVLMKLFWLI